LFLVLALAACSSMHKTIATPPPMPVATGNYPMYGHAADFSWLAGRVERDLQCTYLQFGNPAKEQWGGRIVLDAPDLTSDLQSGDTIVVRGELSRLAYGRCGSPSYLVSSIEEH
jgi:hypothetical protein